jgi:release factor glutamine methyltransferase
MSEEAARVDDAARIGIRELLDGSGLPMHEAERLLVKASGGDRLALIRARDVDTATAERFEEFATRRRRSEPLQHLEGAVQFGPIELHSDARALVPRPETELLWEIVVGRVADPGPTVIVDLCTGSGNLALGLKHAFPEATVYGTDESIDALDLAAENAAFTGLEVEWLHGDLYAALPETIVGGVDLLVANPPYLTQSEFADLPDDVRNHEPYEALVSGPEGHEVLARIAGGAGPWLRAGALLACEISEFQETKALQLFDAFDPEVLDDLTGRPRFVIGRNQS